MVTHTDEKTQEGTGLVWKDQTHVSFGCVRIEMPDTHS